MSAPEPVIVPAGRGAAWLREGLDMVASAPAAWAGITALFMLMGLVLAIIPFAGMLWSVVVPILVGGLMLGCHAMRHGQPLEIRHLFNGFEAPRVQPLALVGALTLAASLVVMLPVMLLVVFGTLFSAFTIGATNASAPSLVVSIVAGLFVVAVALAGGLALSLAMWFAPALVVLRGMAALDALTLSLRAGWRNVGAFLVYGLVTLGLGLVAAAPLVASILLAAARGGEHAGALVVVLVGGTGLFLFLCVLILLPVMWSAMYVSYADVFEDA